MSAGTRRDESEGEEELEDALDGLAAHGARLPELHEVMRAVEAAADVGGAAVDEGGIGSPEDMAHVRSELNNRPRQNHSRRP